MAAVGKAEEPKTSTEKNRGARDRNRTGTPAIHEAADFKSAVSTYFTTRAKGSLSNKKAPLQGL